MTAGLRHAVLVANTTTTRHLRRFAAVPPVTVGRGAAAVTTLAALAVVGGWWSGTVLLAFETPPVVVVGAVTVLGLLTGLGLGAVWAEVRVGLAATTSWWLYASTGVSPRTFLIGRQLVLLAVRIGLFGCFAVTAGLVATLSAPGAGAGARAAGWLAAVLAAPGAASCGIAYASVRLVRAAGHRTRGAAAVVMLAALLFAAVAAVWTGRWVDAVLSAVRPGGGSVAAPLGVHPLDVALGVSAVLVTGAAVAAYARCGVVTWSDVTRRSDSIRARTSGRASRAGGGRVMTELVMLDIRRASRAFEWRVRPALFTLLSLALATAVLGGLGRWAAPGTVDEIAAGPIGATLIGGICAAYTLIVVSALAPFLSLDSDRGAVPLMATFPHGIRALTAARAGTGSAAAVATSALFIGLLAAFAPIGPAAIGTAAVACASVALVAPTGACLVAARSPQPDWKDVSEIGQRGWARTAVTYGVGVAIAVSMTLASSAPWTPSRATAVVLLVVVLTPCAAAVSTAALWTALDRGGSRARR